MKLMRYPIEWLVYLSCQHYNLRFQVIRINPFVRNYMVTAINLLQHLFQRRYHHRTLKAAQSVYSF